MDKKLLELLVCPACKQQLVADTQADALLCEPCALSYPVRDGIPVLLLDEAQTLATQNDSDGQA